MEALPEEQQKQLKSRNLNAAGRRRLFSEWAAKEARKAGADGIYVWICKNPKRTEVVLGPAVPAELFTSRNGDKLLDYLTGWRFDKSPDAELVRRYLRARHPGIGHPANGLAVGRGPGGSRAGRVGSDHVDPQRGNGRPRQRAGREPEPSSRTGRGRTERLPHPQRSRPRLIPKV